MVYLGVDYGRRNLGLALSEGILARPINTLRVKTPEKALALINCVCQKEGIEKIIVGISEGQMAEETHDFGQKLAEFCCLPVEFCDETLSSHEAEKRSGADRNVRQKSARRERRALAHSLAAADILQNYLDRTWYSAETERL